jgi:lipopolysaccharide biosynthesis regulator YciM
MALARLYEKLDRREDAIRLLATKRGDPRLTPDAAAPYLRLLTAEEPTAAFSRVWNLLGDPDAHHGYRCRQCGHREPELRWFCPDCLSPDSFGPDRRAPREAGPAAALPPPAGPPRY